MGRMRIVGMGLLAAALAGCGVWPSGTRSGGPAPVTNYAAAPQDGGVIVAKGDTLYAISRRYGVPLRDLIDANRLAPPYAIQAGQRLALPAPRVHVVRAGDTLYGVSRLYGVDLSQLVRLNELVEPYVIRVGQQLRLPAPGVSGQPPVVAASAPPPQRPVAAPAAVETLPPPSGVASAPTHTPVATPAPGAKPPRPAPAAPWVATARAGAPAPTPSQATPTAPTPVAVAPAPQPAPGARFAWPLRGKVLSGFGPKPGGMHNDGVNIAAERGAPIHAADDGVVVYSGNELRGFGNLLLIKHSGGWVTAYAHADTLKVKRGDQVRRGQVVATVGATGAVPSPQLHFELRKGSRAIDPAPYLDGKKDA